MTTYDPRAYPPVAVTADIVVLTIREGVLSVLLIERGVEPFGGQLALPGGFVQPQESVDQAAVRELKEETDLDLDAIHLEQIGVFSDPARDPRMRVITVAYLGFMPNLPLPRAGTDAAVASWVPAHKALADEAPLAFDHELILQKALHVASSRLEDTTLATAFCGPEFTLRELRRVYEAVWGVRLDSRNFYRKVLGTKNFLIPTGARTTRDGGRPALLYTAGAAGSISPPLNRPESPSTDH